MRATIRPFDDRDVDMVVGLSLRAWEPVFASIERAIGTRIYAVLTPDWRTSQRHAVEAVCAAAETSVWVAEAEGHRRRLRGRPAAQRAADG
jgi:hypothetical protein